MKTIDTYSSFINFFLKQRYLVISLILSLLFMAATVIMFLHIGAISRTILIPLFIALLLLYIVVHSSTSFLAVFKTIKALKRDHIAYEIKRAGALIYQEPLKLKAMHYGNSTNILVPPQKKEVEIIFTNSFAIILIWYKEAGIYKKLAKPLYIDLDDTANSFSQQKLNGLRKVTKNEISYSDEDLVITPTTTKKDFKQLIVSHFKNLIS